VNIMAMMSEIGIIMKGLQFRMPDKSTKEFSDWMKEIQSLSADRQYFLDALRWMYSYDPREEFSESVLRQHPEILSRRGETMDVLIARAVELGATPFDLSSAFVLGQPTYEDKTFALEILDEDGLLSRNPDLSQRLWELVRESNK
jgi:hypothetical protein